MESYGPDTYGQRIAEVYDGLWPNPDEDCLNVLASIGKGVRVLELGIGTGRVALPLKRRGIDIQGIDASIAMVEKLKLKEQGKSIPVTIGDFTSLTVDGKFGLIFIVFNTFFGLTTSESQLSCMKSVSEHLDRNGRFVIEAFVPDVKRFVDGQTVRAIKVEADLVQLDVSRHDPQNQVVTSQHVFIKRSGVEMYPVKIRYAWPVELDLMAQLAGMHLVERWSDWKRTPFSQHSGGHISLFSKQ
jgi:SAM-dependent methyltransferase